MYNQVVSNNDNVTTECTITRIEDGFEYPFKILIREQDKNDRVMAWFVNTDLSKYHEYRENPKTGTNNSKVWFHILEQIVDRLNK